MDQSNTVNGHGVTRNGGTYHPSLVEAIDGESEEVLKKGRKSVGGTGLRRESRRSFVRAALHHHTHTQVPSSASTRQH